MKSENKILIVGILISIILVTITCQNKQQKNFISQLNSSAPNKIVSDEFIYSPKNSTFKIVFPKKPIISNSFDLDHKNIISEVAQLLIPPDGFVKSELIFLDKKDKREITRKILQEFSFANGLSNATVMENTTKVGPCLELRGYKYLKPSTEDSAIAITYTVKCFSDKTSILALFAGCESKHYPTPEIERFYDSIDFQ